MKFNDLLKAINLSKDLLIIFTDYTFVLDKYFEDEKNKKEHEELYNEYQVLNQNLKALKGKYNL